MDDWLTRATAIQGWMSVPELEWLYRKAQRMWTIVEIGCWRGRSTVALAAGCPGTVSTIDHFQGSGEWSHAEAQRVDLYEEAVKNLAPYPNVQIFRMASAEAAPNFGHIDMVFIDGHHGRAEVLDDLHLWGPKARFLCGHDWNRAEVQAALGDYGGSVENPVDSMWVHHA